MSNKDKEIRKIGTALNISGAYLTDQSAAKVSISEEHYANLAWINIGERDVFIDFLKSPGIIENGVPVLGGIRIYMPYAAALRLSEVLNRSIIEAEAAGETESVSMVKQ